MQQQQEQQKQKASSSSRPQRPSLSDQLASIGAKADALTKDIRQTHGLASTVAMAATRDAPLCTFPAHAFVVGRLECRFPSPVTFFRDRCEYTFHHPFEAIEVLMIMFYKDMAHTTFSATTFRFRLLKRLAAFRGGDYEAGNDITITLPASAIKIAKDVVRLGK